MAGRRTGVVPTQLGAHFLRWADEWHVLEHRTLKVRDGKMTMCGLPVPNPQREGVSVRISSRTADYIAHSGMPKPLCEACRGWLHYVEQYGHGGMYREMDECDVEEN